MKFSEQNAEHVLPELRDWLECLLVLTDEIGGGVKCSEDDHLGFMALCFLFKQVDHARSALLLIPSRDAVLVARSMIEGLVQLLWAEDQPSVLPLKWRAFSCIHDWRVLREKVRKGEAVDTEKRASIEEKLREFGEQFLKKKEKAARDNGSVMSDDPYHDNWRTGYGIKDICIDVDGKDMHEHLYVPFSDWHHWGAAGLGSCLNRTDGYVTYSSLSHLESASALAVAFQCVLQTAEVVERRLATGVGLKLSELRDDYIYWHQSE
jgi:hypothetical protein